MEAMVVRMQERDKLKNEPKIDEKTLSTEELEAIRKAARQKYIIDREEKQMSLTKKILDAQSQMFQSDQNQSVLDKLISQMHAKDGTDQLSVIEMKKLEVDKKLYELANKHRLVQKQDDSKLYKMPDVYDSDNNQEDGRKKKMDLLTKRYKKEDGPGANFEDPANTDFDQQKLKSSFAQKK